MPRTRMKYFIFSSCLLVIISLVVFTGCLTKPEKEIVATVNGEEVERAELDEFLNLIYLYWPDYQEAFSEGEQAEAFEQEMLWLLIENKVLNQEVKKIGLEVNEEEIKKDAQKSRDELINSIYNSEDELVSRMRELGLKETALQIIFRDAHMRNLLYAHVGKEVTEEDARKFVEENPGFLERAPYVYAFHILVDTEEEAEEIIRLLEEGADFMELGKERSKDSFVELGRISHGDNLDPLFLEAAFALEPGEISLPVETSFGFHVIKITEKEEARTLTFEDVRDEAMEMRKQMRYQEYFKELMENTPVETF